MAKAVPPDEETFALKLSGKEHAFLQEHAEGLEASTLDQLKKPPPKHGYQLTFDQLEDLAIHITGLVRAVPDADAHRVINGIFRKVSDAMAVAAAEEANADEDLSQVISLKKARDTRDTDKEAKETHKFLDELMANSLASGVQHDLLPPEALAGADLRAMAEELPLPDELRKRMLKPDYKLTVADSMTICKAVVGSIADDPSPESAELLRLMRDVSEENPLDDMLKALDEPKARRKPAKKSRKKK